MTKKSLFLSIVLICFFFATSAVLNKQINRPPIKIEKQETAINFQDSFYRVLFAGYKRVAADLLWITTLLESDLSHYNKKDLNNWMFLRFNSIRKLDPKFLQNYVFATQYLSIVKDDPVGATEIFEQGIRHYPSNYTLLFNGAFIYGFELGDYEKATALYKKLRPFPQRPKFLESLIAKFEYKQSGDAKTTFKILLEIYNQPSQDPTLKAKLGTDLYALKAMIDLECLNSKQSSNCETKDFDGKNYIYESGKYKAPKEFSPYQLYEK